MRDYVTVCPTGILLREKRRIVLVPFSLFLATRLQDVQLISIIRFARYLLFFIFLALDILTLIFTLCLDKYLS